jgi:adenosylhomocysteinase
MDDFEYEIKDISLAESGRYKIAWAYRNMPVLRKIEKQLSEEKPFAGLRIAVSVHVEAKTACLAKVLRSGGADVALTGCNPLSTQDDVAAALVDEGMKVFCIHGANEAEYHKHLLMALSFKPHIVIDDGGDFAKILHTTRRDLLESIIGGCEETTTGVHRLRILERENKLEYPVIAVNDAKCKHLFDNRYGTGQSVWTAIMATTNLIVAGKTIVIAGFGMCGKGIAMRAKGLGAKIIVTEIDPVKASEALMEGYDVMPMEQAVEVGDVFITVTGCRDVISGDQFLKMKDGAICCNAGHFDVEVNLTDLQKLSVSKSALRSGIEGYLLPSGRTICVLAQGRLVNLASGDGHPVEIMDMSFSLQALCARSIAINGRNLEKRVYDTPEDIDEVVARMLLESKEVQVDSLSENQIEYLNSWDS